jgi:hypothetical protein
VNAAEREREPEDRVHELPGIEGVDEDRRGADPHELIVKDGFAFHDRKGGERPDVAEAEHARAVREDADRVPDPREVARALGLAFDGSRDAATPGV